MSDHLTSVAGVSRYRKSQGRGRGSPSRRSPVRGYTLRQSRRLTYVGITNNPRRRAAQHRSSGKRGRLRVDTGAMSRSAARRWEGTTPPGTAGGPGAGALATTRLKAVAGAIDAVILPRFAQFEETDPDSQPDYRPSNRHTNAIFAQRTPDQVNERST